MSHIRVVHIQLRHLLIIMRRVKAYECYLPSAFRHRLTPSTLSFCKEFILIMTEVTNHAYEVYTNEKRLAKSTQKHDISKTEDSQRHSHTLQSNYDVQNVA